MRALALLLLLPSIAFGQGILSGSCGPGQTCVANKFSLAAGNQLCLNSTTCTTIISASASTAGMVFNSAVANTGTNSAYIFDTTTALTSGRKIFSLKTAGSEVASIDYFGIWRGSYGIFSDEVRASRYYSTTQSTPVILASFESDNASFVGVITTTDIAQTTAGGKLLSIRNNNVEKAYFDYLGSVAALSYVFTAGANYQLNISGANMQTYVGNGGNYVIRDGNNGTYWFTANVNGLFTGDIATPNPVPVVHNAQTAAAQAMEYGKTAATGGALAVTFATAFASAPTCTCVITAAVPVACGITTAANTTSVTFTAGAGTDVINWICIGAK